MSKWAGRQTSWEETNEEVARRHQLASTEDTGWLGTIVGLSMAMAALAAILMT